MNNYIICHDEGDKVEVIFDDVWKVMTNTYDQPGWDRDHHLMKTVQWQDVIAAEGQLNVLATVIHCMERVNDPTYDFCGVRVEHGWKVFYRDTMQLMWTVVLEPRHIKYIDLCLAYTNTKLFEQAAEGAVNQRLNDIDDLLRYGNAALPQADAIRGTARSMVIDVLHAASGLDKFSEQDEVGE